MCQFNATDYQVFITGAKISGGLTKLRGKWEKSRAELILVRAVRGRDEARNRRDIAMPRSLSSQSTSRKLTFLNTNWIWAEREAVGWESGDAEPCPPSTRSQGAISENVVITIWTVIHYDAPAKSVRCEVTIITMVSQPRQPLVVLGQVEGNALLTDHFLSHTFNVPGAAHKQRVGLAGKSPPRPRPIKILSQHHSLLRENYICIKLLNVLYYLWALPPFFL